MATKIVTKNSSTASAVPTASDLVQGELAVNVADKRLFTEDNGGSIVELGTNPSTIDINAGSIDGTAIGASSASTGAFTTLTATGLTVDTDTLYVDSTNNRVGIGTTSPSANLDIESTTGNQLRIAYNSSFYWDVEREAATGDLTFTDASNGETVRFTDDGKVGIGTSSPSSKLHLSGDGDSASKLTVQRTGATTGTVSLGYNYVGSFSNNDFKFYTNSAERLRIDSSGRVGVGTTAPSRTLHLKEAVPCVRFEDTDASGVYHDILSEQNKGFCIRVDEGNVASGSYFRVDIDDSEKMRIDSSGNLLVGTTSTATNDVGHKIFGSTGQTVTTASGTNPVLFNRKTSDGDIAVFRKDDTTVGSIGTKSGDLYIGTGDTALRFQDADDYIYPVSTATGTSRDNAIDLGWSGGRFDDIYATNGTIQTSDRNEKQDIAELSEAEQRVAVAAKGLLRKFRWKDSVAEKGDDARIHFGIIAQDLQAAFEAEGLDGGDYAMFISTTWTDEETNEEKTRMGVRYSELLAFIISAI